MKILCALFFVLYISVKPAMAKTSGSLVLSCWYEDKKEELYLHIYNEPEKYSAKLEILNKATGVMAVALENVTVDGAPGGYAADDDSISISMFWNQEGQLEGTLQYVSSQGIRTYSNLTCVHIGADF